MLRFPLEGDSLWYSNIKRKRGCTRMGGTLKWRKEVILGALENTSLKVWIHSLLILDLLWERRRKFGFGGRDSWMGNSLLCSLLARLHRMSLDTYILSLHLSSLRYQLQILFGTCPEKI